MLFVADIGNTSITVGLYDEKNLIKKWFLTTDIKRSEDEYGVMLYNFIKHAKIQKKITGAIISCVVLPLTDVFKKAIEKYLETDVLVVNHKIKTGIKIGQNKPEEVGADRITNAYGALIKYKKPIIVVDFGTATSFDVVDKEGCFIGGIIAAGMKIQADALSSFTSRLPKIKIETPEKTIGKTTIEAMLSGVVLGHAAMIDGLIASCEKELGQKVTTVATGGYSDEIAKNLKRPFDFIDKDLTLEGLYHLWVLNKENV